MLGGLLLSLVTSFPPQKKFKLLLGQEEKKEGGADLGAKSPRACSPSNRPQNSPAQLISSHLTNRRLGSDLWGQEAVAEKQPLKWGGGVSVYYTACWLQLMTLIPYCISLGDRQGTTLWKALCHPAASCGEESGQVPPPLICFSSSIIPDVFTELQAAYV